MKKKVEAKFNELGDMCESGEITPEAAFELFKEFEDEMVIQYGNEMEAAGPPKFDETDPSYRNTNLDDPPGEGPILRWQSRIVLLLEEMLGIQRTGKLNCLLQLKSLDSLSIRLVG